MNYTPPSQWLATLDSDGVPRPPEPPHATIDWETYSAAGLHLVDGKYLSIHGSNKPSDKGLHGVGSAVYARHPTTEILTLSYRLPGGPLRRWRPGQSPPTDLFDWIAAGGLVEAHNVMFERLIWQYVASRHGFPPVPVGQWRCSMAKARVNALPGALGDLTAVLNTPIIKDADGKRLLDKFSVPRKPTKTDPRLRIRPEDDPADAERLYGYCDVDVQSEELASAAMLPMTPAEVEFWQCDQEINWRGVGVDREGVRACIVILEQVFEKYGQEFHDLTNGLRPSQVQALKGWLAAKGLMTTSLSAKTIEAIIGEDDRVDLSLDESEEPDGQDALPFPPTAPLAPDVRRVLEIRQLTGSASVKKLYSMERMATPEGRLCNLYAHHGARTGRPIGQDCQPTNLPKAGPKVRQCSCGRWSGADHTICPWCAVPYAPTKAAEVRKWTWRAVEDVLEIMRSGSVDMVEMFYGDALLAISGCIRSLFVAAEGHDLIASDYSAIEAVTLAALAGEEWRMETFRQAIDIYLAGAAKITGRTVDFYLHYYEEHGEHHEDRQKIGKVSELACGYQGWIGAYRAFGAEGTDEEIKAQILAWRAASPAIVEFWGGQGRGFPGSSRYVPEMYGIEGAFITAVQNPGTVTWARSLSFRYDAAGDYLHMTLPSGRYLTYHQPRLVPSQKRVGELAITYMTWNSNPKYGGTGWICMSTWGGRLAENANQAVAHDIQRYGILALRAAGYPVVLHVYDEDVVEVPAGWGSVEEVEAIMARMPPWAEGWPIRASGGWRGARYRKG